MCGTFSQQLTVKRDLPRTAGAMRDLAVVPGRCDNSPAGRASLQTSSAVPTPFQGEQAREDFSEPLKTRLQICFGAKKAHSPRASQRTKEILANNPQHFRCQAGTKAHQLPTRPRVRPEQRLPGRREGRAAEPGGHTYGTEAGTRQDRGSVCSGRLWSPRRKAFYLRECRGSQRPGESDSWSLEDDDSGVTRGAAGHFAGTTVGRKLDEHIQSHLCALSPAEVLARLRWSRRNGSFWGQRCPYSFCVAGQEAGSPVPRTGQLLPACLSACACSFSSIS